jgi:hypothetical protein
MPFFRLYLHPKSGNCIKKKQMKIYSLLIVMAVMCVVVSCKKDKPTYDNPLQKINEAAATANYPLRRVHFELYTKENFSTDLKNIQFDVFIRTDRKTLLDSAITTMRVADIPDSLHRIIIDKYVPANDTSRLAVGFTYHIENVGYSWYLEDFPAGDTLKVLKYPFR